jgi:ribosomal protein S12 methylthiotransferase
MIDGNLDGQTIGRTLYDAPEIDGQVFVKNGENLSAGDLVSVNIESCDDHDLFGEYVGHELALS